MDLLVIKVKSLVIINVYIRVRQTIGDIVRGLHERLAALFDGHSGPILMGGDFNCPQHTQELQEMMSDLLDLDPVLPDGGEPRPTHARGGVLDWIFTRGPILTSPLRICERGSDHDVLRTTISFESETEAMESSAMEYNWRTLTEMGDEDKEEFYKARDDLLRQAPSLTELQEKLLPAFLTRRLGLKRQTTVATPKGMVSLIFSQATQTRNKTTHFRENNRSCCGGFSASFLVRTPPYHLSVAHFVSCGHRYWDLWGLHNSSVSGARFGLLDSVVYVLQLGYIDSWRLLDYRGLFPALHLGGTIRSCLVSPSRLCLPHIWDYWRTVPSCFLQDLPAVGVPWSSSAICSAPSRRLSALSLDGF